MAMVQVADCRSDGDVVAIRWEIMKIQINTRSLSLSLSPLACPAVHRVSESSK